ncbi:MAG: Undecaprenyl phosphate-alpha-4-amino-4-deoxy-L-arabinose arabinosyl transferase [Bryobacteraceae bacterium]|nr:Undecaprenyl phosphate-alpha-4-amino-4-deoxy-L-arabinose arabinosyl transferase [Bryobacteraceae bacterium]
MPRFARFLLVLPIVYLLYFHGLDSVGLLGADEPRYASIAREMASSGDWITPRLWGEVWFEKPALLYWMMAAAMKLGVRGDWAARLPVALMSVAFLGGYFILLRRRLGGRAAALAAAMLATSAGWLVYSHVAVTDVPMTVCFTVAMLLCGEWIEDGKTGRLWYAGCWMGLAILAKGLVPLVLAAPLAWFGRRRLIELWRLAVAALAVAVPWYALCVGANGRAFLVDFIWKHHFGRFFTSELQHVQPFWFYVPVILGLLFPWTPLLALLRRPETAFARFLWGWALFALVVFSASMNKLPGYMLPLLPPLCALVGAALARARRAEWALAIGAGMVGLMPALAPAIPVAVASGSSRAISSIEGWYALPLGAAAGAAAWMLTRRFGESAGAAWIVCLTAAMVGMLIHDVFPRLDEEVSARRAWRRVEARRAEVCLEDPRRAFRYGMNYYSVMPLPDCSEQERPVHVKR